MSEHSTNFIDETVLGRILSRTQVQRPGQDPHVVIPPRTGRTQINLRDAAFATPWLPAINKFILTVDVQEKSSFTSSSWVVGVHWSVMKNDYVNAIVTSPAIQWTASAPATRNENIAGIPYFRFYVVTAESGADPVAQVIYMVE